MIGYKKWLFVGLSCLLLTATIIRADDPADGEVEDETEDEKPQGTGTAQDVLEKEQPIDEQKVGPSPDAQVSILFTSPENSRDLIAGKIVKYLVGFANRGEKDFIINFAETSFRYPMDFSYYIQNYTAARYNRAVSPKQEATFDYAFIPHESFIGRPLGLVVELQYVDQDGQTFIHTVFNETVNIVEDESAFSTETGFLYLVFAGLGVLLLLLGQHFLSKFTRKSTTSWQSSSSTEEVGTNKNEVDFEWIPADYLAKKSPKPSSPRNRRTTKAN